MENIHLSTIDLSLFFFICSLSIFAVFYAEIRKKKQNPKENFLDYLLLGRKLSLPMFICTLVATWYGGIFGVTEIAYNSGIYNFITQGFFWYVTYIIFAIFLVKKVRQFEAITLPDLVEKAIGPKSAKLAAYFNFINVVPITYIISIGLLLKSLFGFSLLGGMCLGGFSVAVYACFGGFRSVVYSDIIQFFFMCFGVALVLGFSIYTYGGLDFLKTHLPKSYFSVTGQSTWAETLSWGFIALSTLIDPNFYQRVFAANNFKTAKKGILLSTLVWFCFDICTTFGAMYAKAAMPELTSSTAYLNYALQLLPDGLKGIFLAGIAATIISTLDSYLFLASNTLNYDIFKNRKWNTNTKTNYLLSFLFVTGLSILIATFFEGNIKAVWKTLGSLSSACLLIPLALSSFKILKLKDEDFVITCLVSSLSVVLGRWLQIDIDSFYIGSIVSLITAKLLSIYNKYKPKKRAY